MRQEVTRTNKEGKVERASRVLRNVNILGAVALAGAAVIAPPLGVLAGLNAAEAGAFEVARRTAKRHRIAKHNRKGV